MENLRFNKNVYVLGNQAADLDSTVSAFSLAALLEAVNPGLKATPLIQGTEDDLRLKPEIPALFRKTGIELKDEFFLNKESGLPEGAGVILVDHNKPDYPGLESETAGIIDHHRDEGFLQDLSLRIIRKTGSCATLVAELWMESGIPIPPAQRVLLLSAIAVDTGCLAPEWGKTTAVDRRIYNDLSGRVSEQEMAIVLSMPELKLDLSHLNQKDHLRRDFKILKLPGIRSGISSIPMTVKSFFAPGFFDPQCIGSFMREYCPDLLIVMHSENAPFRRQLSFHCAAATEESRFSLSFMIVDVLKELGGFTPLPSPAEGWFSFNQDDRTVSRKVLAPRLKERIEKSIAGARLNSEPEKRGKP